MSVEALAGERSSGVDRRALAAQLGATVASMLPPSQQLVLGWLMVCTPAEQTQAEVREALGLSTGAVSGALRVLTDFALVERLTAEGDRTARYVLPPGAWVRAARYGVEHMHQNLGAMQAALSSLDSDGDERASRNLVEFIDYYRRLADVMGKALPPP